MEQERGTFKVNLSAVWPEASRTTREGWRQLPNFWASTPRRRQIWLKIKRFVEETYIFSAQNLADGAFSAHRYGELYNKNNHLMPEAGVAWFLRFP
jgi:hypothetical protein